MFLRQAANSPRNTAFQAAAVAGDGGRKADPSSPDQIDKPSGHGKRQRKAGNANQTLNERFVATLSVLGSSPLGSGPPRIARSETRGASGPPDPPRGGRAAGNGFFGAGNKGAAKRRPSVDASAATRGLAPRWLVVYLLEESPLSGTQRSRMPQGRLQLAGAQASRSLNERARWFREASLRESHATRPKRTGRRPGLGPA